MATFLKECTVYTTVKLTKGVVKFFQRSADT